MNKILYQHQFLKTISFNIKSKYPDTQLLTLRETEISILIAQGLKNNNICSLLEIQPRTIDNHISSIYLKMCFNKPNIVPRVILALIVNDCIKENIEISGDKVETTPFSLQTETPETPKILHFC